HQQYRIERLSSDAENRCQERRIARYARIHRDEPPARVDTIHSVLQPIPGQVDIEWRIAGAGSGEVENEEGAQHQARRCSRGHIDAHPSFSGHLSASYTAADSTGRAKLLLC